MFAYSSLGLFGNIGEGRREGDREEGEVEGAFLGGERRGERQREGGGDPEFFLPNGQVGVNWPHNLLLGEGGCGLG